MVVKQRNNNCFNNSQRHLYGRYVYCALYCSLVAQTPLMVAGDGVEPPTEDYESSVIPFYKPATFYYFLNQLMILNIQRHHLLP